jgi:transposase
MIHLPASVRVYLCLSACDMRLSFDGLHALVRDHLQLDAFAGHLYLFASRRKDRLKIMYWGVSRSKRRLAELYRRWEWASRSRLSGAGFKPPGAAALKRRGGERPRKRRPRGCQVSVEKMSESKPSDDASSIIQGIVKTGAAQ